MPMGVVRAMAPMRVTHRAGAPPEGLALDVARDIIQTRHPAAHPRTS
jgi:hypothetical protein